jgi:hypothetical protein
MNTKYLLIRVAIVRFVDIVDNVDLSFRFIVVLFCLCFAVPGELAHHVHPAAMKLALRYHIQTLCRSPHCVNSLVQIMSSLWTDTNMWRC